MQTVTLKTEHLTTGYNWKEDNPIIVSENISIELKEGELVCLLGCNGSGKSTLIRTLCGMQPPIHGTVKIDNRSVTEMNGVELSKQLSVVLTERTVPNAMSAFSLVSLGRYPHTNWIGKLTDEDIEIINSSLKAVHAEHLSERDISSISDGERQKVMIARALAQQTKIIIMDEPTAFLDLPRRMDLLRLLKRLAFEKNKSVICSSHDLDLALRGADRVWLLPGDKSLVDGAPEDLVLQDEFENAFNTEDVKFNKEKGIFEIHEKHGGVILLEAYNSLTTHWTGHALERIGYDIVESARDTDCPLKVEVIHDEKGDMWKLTDSDGTEEFRSIYKLTEKLTNYTGR